MKFSVCYWDKRVGKVSESIWASLNDLGHDVDLRRAEFDTDRWTIHLAAQNACAAGIELPRRSIIYNFEQLGSGQSIVTNDYLSLLANNLVWDYSQRNIEWMREHVVSDDALHVPVGFHPILRFGTDKIDQDIDVLFYGSANERRRNIINTLIKDGRKVIHAEINTYGKELDDLIRRSKIVINIHYHETNILETVRISYLLANGKAVVSERNSDTEIPDRLETLVQFASAEELPMCISRLLEDVRERESLAFRGRTGFEALCYCETLESAIVKSLNSAKDAKPEKRLPPIFLNAGSGKNFLEDHLNIDISERWRPDIVCDLSDAGLIGGKFDSDRFGSVVLRRNYFYKVVATDVLEHVLDLKEFMTNIKDLLVVGGEFHIAVPYDLSLQAWQDPTHVRAFNENSWQYYTRWHWYLGWNDYTFDQVQLNFKLTRLGKFMRENGKEREEILRTPRAVAEMNVILRKRKLSSREHENYLKQTSR